MNPRQAIGMDVVVDRLSKGRVTALDLATTNLRQSFF